MGVFVTSGFAAGWLGLATTGRTAAPPAATALAAAASAAPTGRPLAAAGLETSGLGAADDAASEILTGGAAAEDAAGEGPAPDGASDDEAAGVGGVVIGSAAFETCGVSGGVCRVDVVAADAVPPATRAEPKAGLCSDELTPSPHCGSPSPTRCPG